MGGALATTLRRRLSRGRAPLALAVIVAGVPSLSFMDFARVLVTVVAGVMVLVTVPVTVVVTVIVVISGSLSLLSSLSPSYIWWPPRRTFGGLTIGFGETAGGGVTVVTSDVA